MVSVANNVVTMVRGANAGAAKDPGAKSNAGAGEGGSTDAQVTVLFPRAKMMAGNSHRAQKADLDKGSEPAEPDDGSDQAATPDLFGSLVASVEQKLMQQDDQSAAPDDQTTAEVSIDAAPLRGPRFMRLGALPESVQLMARGAPDIAKKGDDFVALVSDKQPTLRAVVDVSKTETNSELPVLDATATQATSTDVVDQTAVEAKVTTEIPVVDVRVVAENTVVQSKVASEIPPAQGKPTKVPAPDQTDAKRAPDRAAAKTDTPNLVPRDAKSAQPVQTVGQPVEQGDDAKAIPETTSPQASANGSAVKSNADEKQTPGTIKNDEPRRVEARVVATSDAAPISSVTMNDGKLLSPVAQIVENIKNAVPAAAPAPERATAAPQMVKTLEIQLQPEGLGPVTVSLKSEQGKLKVQISAKLDTTRQELERSAVELIGGLKAVDPTFTDNDVNFSNQNQGAAADSREQAFSNGNERRGTPEHMPGFGSNGGQDADQSSARARNAGSDRLRPGQAAVAGDRPSSSARADGIYL